MDRVHGRLLRWRLLAPLLAALLAGCATAPGRLVAVDDAGRLDRARVEAAAGPLVARGAAVAVFVVAQGDDRGEDFARRLDAVGLLRGGQIVPEGIGIYVSLAPRYSELRAGGRWSDALPPRRLRAIREEALNVELRAGRPT
ncbi:MAG TPA: TPM domain-containing protein, partial [Roseiflexaceae bacterium]|nr:TPM domain-containing protein [Roseiflexaceae bacterium]